MPVFSERSLKRLSQVHPDLQTIMHYAIQYLDFTVLYGLRTAEEQFTLYKKGRELVADMWIIKDKKKVVTYKDGYLKLSKHQTGEAVDIVFYHKKPPSIQWHDTKANYFLAGYVLGVADMLKKYDAIQHDMIWGGNWDDDDELDDQTFFDLFHFQVA